MSLSLPQLHADTLVRTIRSKAVELGFDLVGIAPANPSQRGDYFREWLAEGKHGEMKYLAERVDLRLDPRRYLEGVKSVICVAINYYSELEPLTDEQKLNHGRIGRYALGYDYHDYLKEKLYALADWLRQTVPGASCRCSVDTGPVLERELASRAGIGWVGKNTCVIHPRVGSFILLGQVLTTLDLPVDEAETDHCGTCTRCLDACPTGAITAPYQLDARKCISYLTIEHRGPINEELALQMGDWVFGCDICQDVCPHNRKAPISPDLHLRPRLTTGTINVDDARRWTLDEYHAATRHTAMRRVKLPQFQRNAQIVLQNLQAIKAKETHPCPESTAFEND